MHDQTEVVKVLLLMKNDGILYDIGKLPPENRVGRKRFVEATTAAQAAANYVSPYHHCYHIFSTALTSLFDSVPPDFARSIASSYSDKISKYIVLFMLSRTCVASVAKITLTVLSW